MIVGGWERGLVRGRPVPAKAFVTRLSARVRFAHDHLFLERKVCQGGVRAKRVNLLDTAGAEASLVMGKSDSVTEMNPQF